MSGSCPPGDDPSGWQARYDSIPIHEGSWDQRTLLLLPRLKEDLPLPEFILLSVLQLMRSDKRAVTLFQALLPWGP